MVVAARNPALGLPHEPLPPSFRRYLRLGLETEKIQAMYVWIDGSGEGIRAKTRTVNFTPKSPKGEKRKRHTPFTVGTNAFICLKPPRVFLRLQKLPGSGPEAFMIRRARECYSTSTNLSIRRPRSWRISSSFSLMLSKVNVYTQYTEPTHMAIHGEWKIIPPSSTRCASQQQKLSCHVVVAQLKRGFFAWQS